MTVWVIFMEKSQLDGQQRRARHSAPSVVRISKASVAPTSNGPLPAYIRAHAEQIQSSGNIPASRINLWLEAGLTSASSRYQPGQPQLFTPRQPFGKTS